MGFVAVFGGAAETTIASTLLAMELFGAGAGSYAAMACVFASLFSWHSGIYRSQRIAVNKHELTIHPEESIAPEQDSVQF